MSGIRLNACHIILPTCIDRLDFLFPFYFTDHKKSLRKCGYIFQRAELQNCTPPPLCFQSKENNKVAKEPQGLLLIPLPSLKRQIL